MIGTVEVKVNAARPNMPLPPMFAFKGSPSSLRIMDVPKSIGKWNITNVKVVFKYPNNQVVTKVATRNGNVWVATIDGCSTSGKVSNGYEVVADGVNEGGTNTTGYVLGVGDVYILNRDSTISDSDDKFYLKLCATTPTTPNKGDVVIDGGTIKFYNGTSWFSQDVPTKTSDLVNDSRFITSNDIPTIPSKTSDLTNDSDYTTKSYVDGLIGTVLTEEM